MKNNKQRDHRRAPAVHQSQPERADPVTIDAFFFFEPHILKGRTIWKIYGKKSSAPIGQTRRQWEAETLCSFLNLIRSGPQGQPTLNSSTRCKKNSQTASASCRKSRLKTY
jgi:hypothetical protein